MCQGLGPKKHDEISEFDRNSSIIAILLLVVIIAILVIVVIIAILLIVVIIAILLIVVIIAIH